MKISMRQGIGLFFLVAFLVIGGVFIFSHQAFAQIAEGESCTLVAFGGTACDAGLDCISGKCQVPPTIPEGESCTLVAFGGTACDAGLDCISGKCQPEGGGSGPGGGGGSGPGGGGGTGPGTTFTIENKFAFGTLEEALSAIANFLFIISIPIAVIFIIIGGFQFATAAGNPEKINAGKRTITWAVIGIAVLLVAGSIAKLIENILT